MCGELTDAELGYPQAVTVLRSTGNPYALARGLLDHGSALAELERPGEATSALQEARSLFLELRATPWLERTGRALEPLVLA